MAKIARKTMQIFGSAAGVGQIAQFGSLAASAPVFTTDPNVIQALANYLGGWFSGVEGANSPAIEDMNALCYLYAYQLAYLYQEGIPEWDTATTYFIGSVAQDGSGNAYSSLTNTNLGNALTNASFWKPFGGGINLVSINPGTQSPYVLGAADSGKTFLVNSVNGAMTFNFPAPSLNYKIKVKDSGFNANVNAITFTQNASEKLENLAASYVAQANGGIWEWASDGTNWFITGR